MKSTILNKVNYVFLLSFVSISFAFCQTVNIESLKNKIVNLGEVVEGNDDFSSFKPLDSLLKDVEIVMLGEQSHGEGTVYETKIKLIKYLHQNLGFDILAFESGFYDCKKAWDLIKDGKDVRTTLGESVTGIWSTTKQFIPLSNYIEKTLKSKNKLKVLGFDSQFTGRLSERHYTNDLAGYFETIGHTISKDENWNRLEFNLQMSSIEEFKKIKKKSVIQDTLYLNKLIGKIKTTESTPIAKFWINSIKSAKCYLSDMVLKTNFRDQQMASNLMEIKKAHPDRKIICWGATSHFLYNSEEIEGKGFILKTLLGDYYKTTPMMGNYIKDILKDKVYTIGFTAFEGEYGYMSRKKIKKGKTNSVEYLLSKSNKNNFLLDLKNLDFSNYYSRPLGNYYMTNNIAHVMDAVIFNRNMSPSVMDRNFLLKIYPENKWIKPE